MNHHSTMKIVQLCLVLSFGVIATEASAKSKSSISSKTYEIREMCVKQAQAQYPETGRGPAEVMEQRKYVYMSCAKKNGIRP